MDDNNSTQGKLVGICFLVWFLASVGLLFYYGGIANNTPVTLIIFGQFFLVFGIIILLAGAPKPVALLFTLVGLGIIAVTVICNWGERFGIVIEDKERFLAVLLVSLFPLIGLGMLLAGAGKLMSGSSSFDTYVTAECVSLKTSYNDGHRLYMPVYKYLYNGTEYISQTNVYSNVNVPKVGEQIEIRIDSTAPERIFDSSVKLGYLVLIGMGLIFIAVGGAALYFSFFAQ